MLLFSKTIDFRHNSIEDGAQSLLELLKSKNIKVDLTENAEYFTEDSLKQYATIVFLNTSGNILNNTQQADLERYIQAGGGFVGIHSATDTEYNWPWYNGLVGAYFDSHPNIQDANLRCTNEGEACCKHLPEVWTLNEEWYNFKSINPNIEVLMEVDESSYSGGTNGEKHPVVWKHEYDGGRSFYTALGHKKETFKDPLFLEQLWVGIEYTVGDNNLDYSKATSLRVPEENRFNKRVLDFNLDEPMEMDELEDLGIIFIERRGAIKFFDYQSESVRSLDTIDVQYENEDGLLGLAIDPNFSENNWIYLFYSPNIEEATQHISRFTLREDKLSEEKVLLKIPLIRKCCHSGGSLEFGEDGLLYIGVGDNTNPFESSGYAPIDERAGRQLYDAQRSAANTNDLRGKILRIKPEDDGSYSIPKGNLFPPGTEKCRPEIYVMGCRNPFRFSIDSKTNYLYWGDVGPDAGTKDSLRGPAGMGEFDQAKEAGFYGWPYSRGNNQMYNDYSFESEIPDVAFKADRIINNSPNNTGAQNLPPIQQSQIWYSYKESNQFPWLGSGGVNPMSGPIYHAEDHAKRTNNFPPYFEDKWFVYEWMRDWIHVVHLDEDHQYVQADPFMPNMEFSHPIDMLFSTEGELYVLEYGQKWNSRNLDARLSVITYNSGNRPPIAKFNSDKEVGSIPLKIQFSATESLDHDNDDITYSWDLGQKTIETDSPDLSYIFTEAGIYDVKLTVSDSKEGSGTFSKKIIAGNDAPTIKFNLGDNNTTYWKNKTLDYQIEVSDNEDGKTSSGTIDTSKVKVTFTYIPEGQDIIQATIGHQQNVVPKGLSLINASGCKACHAIDKKVAGPSYEEIAMHYNKGDKEMLMRSIIKGSQGKWGENMMAPHPQLKMEDVDEIVSYILSLDPNKHLKEKNLPLEGSLVFDEHSEGDVAGKYILIASYLDQGNADVEGSSLSAVEEFIFIPPRIELEDAVHLDKGLSVWDTQGKSVVGSINDGKKIKISPISFDNLSSISIGALFNKEYQYYGKVELRRGHENGQLLGSGEIKYFDKEKNGQKVFKIDTKPSIGSDTLFMIFNNSNDKDQFTMNGDWIQLNYDR